MNIIRVEPIYELEPFKDYIENKFNNKTIWQNLEKASKDYYCEYLKTIGEVTSCKAPGDDYPFPKGRHWESSRIQPAMVFLDRSCQNELMRSNNFDVKVTVKKCTEVEALPKNYYGCEGILQILSRGQQA